MKVTYHEPTVTWSNHFSATHIFMITYSSTCKSKYQTGYMQLRSWDEYHIAKIQDDSNAGGDNFNTLRPRPNWRHFADDIFKCIFVNENAWILLKISLKFVPKVRIDNIPALVQAMAWCRPGDEPLSETMMVSLPTHINVTRPQWVKSIGYG